MKYIVFDLEWNQCPTGKEKENKRLPFEIIEIGAVKLNENLEKIDEFTTTIKPKVYKNLHYKIKEINKITQKELSESKGFKQAVTEFLDWCEDDCTYCTWGSLDLMELQRNMQFYKMGRVFPFPLLYLDIQKMFSIDKEDGKSRRSLMHAVEFLNKEMDDGFHRALNDSIYTWKVMQKIDFERVKSFYSIDCYFVPRNKQEEIYARFLTYSKYISRRFSSKEKALMDPEVVSLRCSECNEPIDIKIPWFSDNAKTYYALGHCKEHGYMKCKIRMKKNINNKIYAVKTVSPATKETIWQIEEKQGIIREKRRERRNRLHEREHEQDYEMKSNNEEDRMV